jgi:hypothetical protein
MRTYDYETEVWVPARTSLFSDQTAGQGDGNGGAGDGGNPPAQSQTQPQNQGTNWEAAYKTLQRNHNDLQAKFTGVEGQNNNLAAQLATRANEFSNVQTQLHAATANIETLTSQVTGLESERGSLAATLERSKLIMGEFPQLAMFEAQGLLPAADNVDTMRDVFAKFSATIQGIQESAISNLMVGASPEPVGGSDAGDGKPVTMTVDQAWQKVVQLSGGNDNAAYDAAYKEYLDLLSNEQEISGNME